MPLGFSARTWLFSVRSVSSVAKLCLFDTMTKDTISMQLAREYVIKNRLGLHARAAAQLVQTANRFRSEVTVEKDGMQVNGKSIMGILMLAAPQGSRIRVAVTGEDAQQALASLGQLIDDGFGEE